MLLGENQRAGRLGGAGGGGGGWKLDKSDCDGVTIQIPYGVDVLHRPASHPIFSYWVG